MNINLVAFTDSKTIEELSLKFKDEIVIVASDFSEIDLKEFNSKKRKSKVKLYSAKLFTKKDNNAFQKFSKLADFIVIKGGSIEMNSWALTKKNCILLQPFSSDRNSVDLASANVCKQNNIIPCIDFSEFLNAHGFRQTQLMKNAMLGLKLFAKAETPLLFVSGAGKKSEMRSSADLISFSETLGLKREKAVKLSNEASKNIIGG